LLDIAQAARLVIEFTQGMTKEQFLEDIKTQSAVLYQLLVMGEAVKRLSCEFRARHPHIPWSLIAGMRDHLIHGYDIADFAYASPPWSQRLSSMALGHNLVRIDEDGQSDYSNVLDELTRFCQRWKIRELALFGSALRDDFGPDSDVDILVDFDKDADWSLLNHIQMQQELQTFYPCLPYAGYSALLTRSNPSSPPRRRVQLTLDIADL